MIKYYRKLLFPFILLFFLSIFLYCFSTVTSPLYPNNYGVDSAFYRVIGSSVLKGKTLYSEIWDNKGPVLFFIQALGTIAGTKNSPVSITFILQITSLFLTILFMLKADQRIAPQNSGKVRFLLITISACTVFCLTMEGGNLCEEWSLPFISCSLYLFSSYALQASADPRHPVRYAFIHGVCFAMIAFIRINNAVSICTGILVIGIYLISKKQWKNLLKNAAFGLLGIMAVLVPVLLYFYTKNALNEMIYGVFLYNLKYIGDRSRKAFEGTEFLIRYAPIAASMLMILLDPIRKRTIRLMDILMLCVVSANGLILWQSNEFRHYFTIMVPVYAFVLVLYADLRNIPGLFLMLAVSIFFIRQDAAIVSGLPGIHSLPPKYSGTAQIPEEEKKNSIAVWTRPDIYLNTGFEPCSRFCAYQFIHFPVDPEMYEEYLSDIRTKQPQWIMVLSGYEGIYPEIETILNTEYQFRFSEDNVDFFRRSD